MKTRLAIALASIAFSTFAGADTYPSKVVTFVVPAVAGGSLDVLARTLAEEMSRTMGQPVIIDNKPGAAGMIAVQAVARAVPDGHTVLITHSGPILTAPFMFARVPYDVRRDLAFVSQLCAGQLVLAVNADKVPARSMKEFVAWAGRNKGKVSYGSYGIGSAGHLMGAYLSQSRALDMTHVPYKGEPPMVQDLVGGEISWAIGTLGSLAPQLATGRVRALAVLGERRPADLPDVPTIAEAGFPDPEFRTTGWVAMMAPARTPAPVLERLEKEARAAAQTTPMKARFQAFGMEAMGTGSVEFRRDYETSVKITENLIRLSGAKAE